METKSDKWGLVIRLIGSTLLIIWLLNKFEWNTIIEVAKQGSVPYIIAAVIAIQATVLPSIWKWKILVDASFHSKNKHGASFTKLWRLYYIGLFFNNFLPGSVGGDVVRVYYLGRITGIPIATASVGFERITSGAALIIITIFSTFSMEIALDILLPILLITGAVLLVLYIFWKWINRNQVNDVILKKFPRSKVSLGMKKVKGTLLDIGNTVSDYRKEGLKWWLNIVLLSILFQVGMSLINHLLFVSFDIHVSWIKMLVIITLISVLTMLPISVNGIGVREGCYIFFFNDLGVPDEVSLTVSLMFFLLVSLSSLAGGLFWMVERGRKG